MSNYDNNQIKHSYRLACCIRLPFTLLVVLMCFIGQFSIDCLSILTYLLTIIETLLSVSKRKKLALQIV